MRPPPSQYIAKAVKLHRASPDNSNTQCWVPNSLYSFYSSNLCFASVLNSDTVVVNASNKVGSIVRNRLCTGLI